MCRLIRPRVPGSFALHVLIREEHCELADGVKMSLGWNLEWKEAGSPLDSSEEEHCPLNSLSGVNLLSSQSLQPPLPLLYYNRERERERWSVPASPVKYFWRRREM